MLFRGKSLFAHHQRGALLIFSIFVIPLVLAFSALIIDITHLTMIKSQLQLAADAGAHAGAEVAYVQTLDMGTTAQQYIDQNLAASGREAETTVSVVVGCWDGTVIDSTCAQPNAVSVGLSYDVGYFLGAFVGKNSDVARVEALAFRADQASTVLVR